MRERDGFRCTKCGTTDRRHVAETGRRLQVHRVTPGAMYTIEGCVLLCRKCHGAEPRRRRGEPDLEGYPSLPVRLPEKHRTALEALKKKHRRTVTEEVQIALEKHYREEGIPFA